MECHLIEYSCVNKSIPLHALMPFGGSLCDMKYFNFRFYDSWTNSKTTVRLFLIATILFDDNYLLFIFLKKSFFLLKHFELPRFWTFLHCIEIKFLGPLQKAFYPLDPNFMRKLEEVWPQDAIMSL